MRGRVSRDNPGHSECNVHVVGSLVTAAPHPRRLRTVAMLRARRLNSSLLCFPPSVFLPLPMKPSQEPSKSSSKTCFHVPPSLSPWTGVPSPPAAQKESAGCASSPVSREKWKLRLVFSYALVPTLDLFQGQCSRAPHFLLKSRL